MKAHGVAGPRAVPAAALRVVASPGRPLEMATLATMEGRFGHDFSRIRVHDDGEAADSAHAVHASAYSIGPHLVFGRQRYAPGTREGDALLAHELAHAVQHDRHPGAAGGGAVSSPSAPDEREAASAADRVAQGAPAGPLTAAPSAALHREEEEIAPLTGDLMKYLRKIRRSGRIEGDDDSDDKAVRIVRLWSAGRFERLEGRDKAILIWELLDGPTTGPDEQAIVELLERSDNDHLDKIFKFYGEQIQKQITEDVPDDAGSQLADFCRRRWEGGIKAFRKGKGAPREGSRPIPLGVSLPGPIPEKEEDPYKPPPDRAEQTRSSSPHEILSFQGGEPTVTPAALEANMRALAERHGAPPGLSFTEVVDVLMTNHDVREFVFDAVLEFQRNGLIPPGSIEKGTKMGLEEGLKAGLKALVEIAARRPSTEPQPFSTGPVVTSDQSKQTDVLPAFPIPYDSSPAARSASLPSIRIRRGALQTKFKAGASIEFEFTVPDYFRGRAAIEILDDGGAVLGPAVALEGLGGARTVAAPRKAGRYRLRIRPADDPDSTSIAESDYFGVQP